MTAHTPGPWRLHTRHYLEVCNYDSVPVAQCGVRSRTFKEKELAAEQQANADLIKTAPDLLAALKAMIEPFAVWTDEELRPNLASSQARAILVARAVIARAEAKSP